MKKIVLGFVVLAATVSCQHPAGVVKHDVQTEHIMSKAQQDKLTGEEAVASLKQGNNRFLSEDTVKRNHMAQLRKAVDGQYPKAIVLSCVDSRVPVEDVFDQGIGDIFVARVAGNFVTPEILGSIEYATAVVGVKLVLVMGHEHCGAIKSTIDNVKLGPNIASLVDAIQPAVASTKYTGARTSKNPAFVHEACQNNVKVTLANMRKRSKIISDLEKKGSIILRGAMFDMDTGKVDFFE